MNATYENIRDAGNLLALLVRDRARYEPKKDPLLIRYRDLRPLIMQVTDRDTLESIEAQKVLRRPGWRATKAERQEMKDGTFILNPAPAPVPTPDYDELYRALLTLIHDFPSWVAASEQFAARYKALPKAPK